MSAVVELGFQPSVYVVAAICGNWWQESTINPGIWEDLTPGAPGYGLGQWTGPRKTALFNYLIENDYNQDSGTGQMAFFIEEDYWTPNGYAASFPTLMDFLKSDSTDLQFLTYAFLQGWEGIWDGSEQTRYEAAVQCLEYIQLHEQDEPQTSFYKGNRFLSIPERLHNAVVVYRRLGGILTGGSGMPIYMMIRYNW